LAKAVLSWSAILETNPAAGLEKPEAGVKRELVAVWRAAEKLGWPFGVAVKLLILTGARLPGYMAQSSTTFDPLVIRHPVAATGPINCC
jgi:hypothetical protein